jgi:uncharacterized protein
MNIRLLRSSDADVTERFLMRHRDSSMFLRANSRRVGLDYRPERLHATYVGAFHGDELTGVVAHAWNGMIIPQAPAEPEMLAQACIEESRRAVAGFIGPLEQVTRARATLGMIDRPVASAEDEGLYGVNLSDIVIPDALARGTITYRPPTTDDRDTLCRWRFSYETETLGAADSEETRQHAASVLDHQIAEGNAWVAVQDGRLLSLSAFNATLPDIVQLGGIYTPPELRGRGYARVAVAGSLIAARDRGAARAVLFTGNPSAARSYEAVGFRRVGDFGMVLFQ